MADPVLNSLRRKLRVYEGAGMTDHAKRVKARIAKLERPKSKKAESTPPKEDVVVLSEET